MFRHLRNRLIFVNLAVTTTVLVLAFSTVYAVALRDARHRQEVVTSVDPDNPGVFGITWVTVQMVRRQLEAEQREALNSLLVSLVASGIMVEAAVVFLSYVLAEAAIHPIKEAYEAQKNFIANASHEMKTPIAAIMANLEVADIKGNQWIDNVNQEVKYMADLNQDLLTLARAENSMTLAKTEDLVALKDFVEEIVAPFRPRVKTQKISFQLHVSAKPSKVKLYKADFQQITSILLDNALKYCDKKVIMNVNGKVLSIENDGTMIAPEDLPKVFERFYQTDKSNEGVGLGLSIAQMIAERNGWKLQASCSGKMTKFTLSF